MSEREGPSDEQIDELYSELDEVAQSAMSEHLGPFTIANLIHDYAEQLKVETLLQKRISERSSEDGRGVETRVQQRLAEQES